MRWLLKKRLSASHSLRHHCTNEADINGEKGFLKTKTLCLHLGRKNADADRLETHWKEMQPVTEAKREILLACKQNPSSNTRDALRCARNKAQQTYNHCANGYWLDLLSRKTQSATGTDKARSMYQATGLN
ncbi:hypothetical protein ElyMa_005188400 [Elysia marginata]|uniref:Uncharacterized protein n=1 Tax=Elysia marginata TaxID=1093978 RepID=A0AAV4JW69_9GAST|nr:hypothetical protein ElyMa_005188400 [Elysia marginata]